MRTGTVVLEKTRDGGYSAYLPDLPGCIATAASLQAAKDEIADALEFHLEGMEQDGLEIPEEFQGEYELKYKTDVASLFEWFSGILTKSGVSKLTGMNQSLISQYASGIKTPSSTQTKRIESALHDLGHELIEIQL